jgi:hypothetical protein
MATRRLWMLVTTFARAIPFAVQPSAAQVEARVSWRPRMRRAARSACRRGARRGVRPARSAAGAHRSSRPPQLWQRRRRERLRGRVACAARQAGPLSRRCAGAPGLRCACACAGGMRRKQVAGGQALWQAPGAQVETFAKGDAVAAIAVALARQLPRLPLQRAARAGERASTQRVSSAHAHRRTHKPAPQSARAFCGSSPSRSSTARRHTRQLISILQPRREPATEFFRCSASRRMRLNAAGWSAPRTHARLTWARLTFSHSLASACGTTAATTVTLRLPTADIGVTRSRAAAWHAAHASAAAGAATAARRWWLAAAGREAVFCTPCQQRARIVANVPTRAHSTALSVRPCLASAQHHVRRARHARAVGPPRPWPRRRRACALPCFALPAARRVAGPPAAAVSQGARASPTRHAHLARARRYTRRHASCD